MNKSNCSKKTKLTLLYPRNQNLPRKDVLIMHVTAATQTIFRIIFGTVLYFSRISYSYILLKLVQEKYLNAVIKV